MTMHHFATGLFILLAAVPAAADDTDTIGGSGGSAFRLVCPAGQFLVGVTGRAGDWLDQVAPVCAPIDGALRWTGPPSNGAATGGSGGGPFTTMCPQDSVVDRFSGYALDGRGYVFNVGVLCRLTGPKGVEHREGSPRLVGGQLDTAAGAGFECPAGQAANGIVGRSGIYVDRFGLSCARILSGGPFPARPPAADRVIAGTKMRGPVASPGGSLEGALVGRWSSRVFPPPNGGLLVFRTMPDGNPACASYDGANCLWGKSIEQIQFAAVIPLICGDPHRAVWGVTGYEDPNHWCSLARRNP